MKTFRILCAMILLAMSFITMSCSAQEQSQIILGDRKGEVFFWSNKWEDLPVKSHINEGSFIKTGKNSQAVLALGKKAVVTLGEDTAVKIARAMFDDKNEIREIKVQLPNGKIWSVVEKLPAADRKFEIETPNTLASIRGTIFSAGYVPKDDSTTVGVVAGEVRVASTKTAAYVILKENMSTVVVANAAPVSPQLLEEKEKQEWEQWKNSIPFSGMGIVGGIAEMNAMQIQEASRIVREMGIVKQKTPFVMRDFASIESGITLFYSDTGQVPAKLKDLIENPGVQGWKGPYLGVGTTFMDPYGHPYQYKPNKKTPGGKDYVELSTFGLIGAAGDTYGEEKKIIFVDKLKEKLK